MTPGPPIRSPWLGVATLFALTSCGASPPPRTPSSSPAVSQEVARTEPPNEEVPAAEQPSESPAPGPDWDAMALAANAWTTDTPGRAWNGGGMQVQLLRPIDLRLPAACAPPASDPDRVPRVRRDPATVGPSPPISAELIGRIVRRDEAVARCIQTCGPGTDLFELLVDASGEVRHGFLRARTHGVPLRSECLGAALGNLRFPETQRGPTVRMIVPLRVHTLE